MEFRRVLFRSPLRIKCGLTEDQLLPCGYVCMCMPVCVCVCVRVCVCTIKDGRHNDNILSPGCLCLTGIKVFRHRAGFPACGVWLRKKVLYIKFKKKKEKHVSISSPSLSSL